MQTSEAWFFGLIRLSSGLRFVSSSDRFCAIRFVDVDFASSDLVSHRGSGLMQSIKHMIIQKMNSD